MPTIRLVLVTLSLFLLSSASWGQLLTRLAGGKESPVPGMVTYGKTPARSATMTLHLRAQYRPTSLVITRSPGGSLSIFTPYQKTRLLLPIDFGESFEGLTKSGGLKKGFYIQAAEYDFTGDREPEIIVAVGDGLVNLEINIFQYRPPQTDRGVGAWERVGSFSGQSKAMLERNSVILPYGSQGLFDQHQWGKGGFAQVN